MSNDNNFSKSEEIEIYYVIAFHLYKAVRVKAMFYNFLIIYSYF